jgi:hypothetical protein
LVRFAEIDLGIIRSAKQEALPVHRGPAETRNGRTVAGRSASPP